ncbi:MAG TPA: TadE family protein [Pyrinomonadaceae bacterium]|nr:TadE family protein [Pyrinomonadaceae bacterium]
MKSFNQRQNERGTTVAEFAVVALLFFVIIFGIIEFGRLLYTHNALTDATRRGARFASLHTKEDGDKVIDEVIYGSKASLPGFNRTTATPIINGLTRTMVKVNYEGASATIGYGTNLGTATVKIDGYQFDLLIPVIGRQLTLPAYSTTLTAESAGLLVEPIPVGP